MIYVNGDSFSRNTWSAENPIDYSWPRQLGQILQVEVINDSAGCGSNNRMLSGLHALYLQGQRPDLVLIALTGIGRWSLPTARQGYWNINASGAFNDRTGATNDELAKIWATEVYDQVELTYQYFNTIWQIHEFCKNYLRCPVIFFNAWSAANETIEHQVFDAVELDRWLLDELGSDSQIFIDRYRTMFGFFSRCRESWRFERKPFTDILGPDDLYDQWGPDPDHPNPQGHTKIAHFVLGKIQDFLPKYPDILKGHFG